MERFKTLILTVTALVTGITAFTVYKLKTKDSNVQASLVNSVFYVGIGMGHGTGGLVSYKGKNYLLTNKHVCVYATEETPIIVRSAVTEQAQTSNILAVSEDADLCIIDATGIIGKPLVLSEKESQIGDEVFTMGFPSVEIMPYLKGFHFNSDNIPLIIIANMPEQMYSKCEDYGGTVTREEFDIPMGFFVLKSFVTHCTQFMDLQQTTIVSEPGVSGSPVLNEQAKLVGVANSVFSSSGHLMMVPLREVIKVLEQLR